MYETLFSEIKAIDTCSSRHRIVTVTSAVTGCGASSDTWVVMTRSGQMESAYEACGQSYPSPCHLPTNSVLSAYWS